LAKTTKVICPTCGKEFETTESRIKEGRGKYCSKICFNGREKVKVYCNCVVCGKQTSYYASNKNQRNSKDHYCSRKCFGIGKTTKIKMYCDTCGKAIYVKPYKTKDRKNHFCSNRCSAKHEHNRGENHPKFNPMLTDDERNDKRAYIGYFNWRLAVLRNSSYTCQHCGSNSKLLYAHHIIPYAKDKSLRLEISNGIALCKDCHMKEHARLRKVAKQQACLF